MVITQAAAPKPPAARQELFALAARELTSVASMRSARPTIPAALTGLATGALPDQREDWKQAIRVATLLSTAVDVVGMERAFAACPPAPRLWEQIPVFAT